MLLVQAGFGGFFGNSAKLILSEVSREHGQAAVDRMIRECGLDKCLTFNRATGLKADWSSKNRNRRLHGLQEVEQHGEQLTEKYVASTLTTRRLQHVRQYRLCACLRRRRHPCDGVVSIFWILGNPPATTACAKLPPRSRRAPRPTSTASTAPLGSSASFSSFLSGCSSAAHRHRLRRRRGALGHGRLHRHEHLGARKRAHRRGAGVRGAECGAADCVPRRSAITGLLVVGLGLAGVTGYYWVLSTMTPAGQAGLADAARRPRLRRFADFDLRPSRRRHLHQGRRRRRRPGGQGRGRHPRGRPAQPGGDRRQRGRQRGRLRRHGPRTCSRPTRSPSSPPCC